MNLNKILNFHGLAIICLALASLIYSFKLHYLNERVTKLEVRITKLEILVNRGHFKAPRIS